MFNVRTDFGAIGDSKSHPLSEFFPTLQAAQAKYPCAVSLQDEIDWAAIQTAIDTAVFTYPLNSAPTQQPQLVTGSTIYLPGGMYLIDRPLTISNVATWLLGDGMTTTTIVVTAAGQANGMQYAVIFNKTYIGPPSGIRQLEIKNFPFGPIGSPAYCAGVWVNTTNVVFLDHLWVNGMLGGVYTTESGDNIYESCYCEVNVNYGFYTTTSAPMRFINCASFDNQQYGFVFEGLDANHPYGTLMTGCQSVGDATAGIYISNYNDIDITGCSVSGVGSGTTTQTVTGISISNANRISITGGRVLDPAKTGIAISGSSVVNISNFTISPVASGGTGITADAASSNVTLIGSTMNVASGGTPTAISAKTVIELGNNFIQAPGGTTTMSAEATRARHRRY